MPTDPMKPSEAIDIALKHADLGLKMLQFFLIASVAIGGWIVSSTDLLRTAAFSEDRFAWAAMFFFVGAVTWAALISVYARINACYALARTLAANEPEEVRRDIERICRTVKPRIIHFGLPVFVLMVVALLLGFR